MHEYFTRKSTDWNILDFLNKSDMETFDKKIEQYITCLETIVSNETGSRHEKAQLLLNKYKQASIKIGRFKVLDKAVILRSRLRADLAPMQGSRPDRHLARKWRDEQSNNQGITGTSIHLFNPKFKGSSIGIGTINNGTFNTELPRKSALEKDENSNYSKNSNMEETYLFGEVNEQSILSTIDEKSLNNEVIVLDVCTGNESVYNWSDLKESFEKYKTSVPKSKRIVTPAYWGILDLTKESLYNVQEIKDNVVKCISGEFYRKVGWNPKPPSVILQNYFSNNCRSDLDKDHKNFNIHIQYMISNMSYLKNNVSEEVLKMTTVFPFYRGIISSLFIQDRWGEIQVHSTNEARNENNNPFARSKIGRKADMVGILSRTPQKAEILFGEVSGGLNSFGLPSATRKKRFLDKIKLSVMLRDSINSLLKGWDHINAEERKSIILYGWTLHGFELNIYAMSWNDDGIYLFGLVDKAIIPSSEDCAGMFEDLYCVFKELEHKLKQTEVVINNLNLKNTKNKRRRLAEKTSPKLNINRTPN
nr:9328_t:CDS:10 [Entrophospora candida]